jgi:AraC-like DNA-binding protein
MSKLKKSFFTTSNLPVDRKLPTWRESIGTLFEVIPSRRKPDDSLDASLTSYLLNEQIMLSLCKTTSQQFTRSPLRSTADGLDYYLIQTHLTGSQDVTRAGKETNCAPGDLMIIDLADKHTAMTDDFSHLTLVIPRYLLAPLLLNPDSQEGRVLKGDNGLTTLAVNHIRTLAQVMDTLTQAQVETTIEPTLLLLASALNGSIDSIESSTSGAMKSLLTRAKLEIEQNLHCNLTVEFLCSRLNLSRAGLYRLFTPLGGVRAYIQDRRLRRAAEDIVSAKMANRPIYEIAYHWGFGSEAHFSRAFRKKFDVSPSEARHARKLIQSGDSLLVGEEVGDRQYEQWLSETLKH